MKLFRFHVFVCDRQKPEGVPCCGARGSGQVLEALRREVNARGLEDDVRVTACGSFLEDEHNFQGVGEKDEDSAFSGAHAAAGGRGRIGRGRPVSGTFKIKSPSTHHILNDLADLGHSETSGHSYLWASC